MKTNKISPFTGGPVELCSRPATTHFRGEPFAYTGFFYRCVDSGREYTDNELDDRSLEMVYSQYRLRHGIPSREEIKAIREQYGFSALAMSRILGLGDNQYRLYEEGTIPSESAGKLIKLARRRENMLALLEASQNAFTAKEYHRFYEMVQNAAALVLLPVTDSLYAGQAFSEQRSGQMIAKKITKTNYYKSGSYADAREG